MSVRLTVYRHRPLVPSVFKLTFSYVTIYLFLCSVFRLLYMLIQMNEWFVYLLVRLTIVPWYSLYSNRLFIQYYDMSLQVVLLFCYCPIISSGFLLFMTQSLFQTTVKRCFFNIHCTCTCIAI